MVVGMAMENWMVGLMHEAGGDFCWQPGEWERDGVFGTPDGISTYSVVADPFGPFDDPPTPVTRVDVPMVEEFKATWKSQRTHGDVLKQKMWIWQLAGNCRAMGATVGMLHVFWVNGDYRPPTPKYCRYVVEFEQRELDEFWRNVVVANRDKPGVVREEHR